MRMYLTANALFLIQILILFLRLQLMKNSVRYGKNVIVNVLTISMKMEFVMKKNYQMIVVLILNGLTL